MSRLLSWANTPLDPAGLAAFRILFGLLTFASTARFIASGWVHDFFVKPDFHFKFFGAGWAIVPPVEMIYALLGLMLVASALITLGVLFRTAALVFAACFTYVELLDVTNYLNHYYLVTLLSLVLAATPADAALALRRTPGRAPRWAYALLRFQVAIVYVYAALAKANTDWLLHGQPLGIWLAARSELPLLGQYFVNPDLALVMSWAGFLYDATIVVWLSWARTRGLAYVAVVGFHAFTGLLFNIGMFPWLMIVATTIYFSPTWPRRFLRPAPDINPSLRRPLPSLGVALITLWMAFHIAWPARFLVYDGPVNWHEQGMRFAWKVMVREKSGDVSFLVTRKGRRRPERVPPARYLSSAQEREMSGQPDLILQLAHHIAADYRARGYEQVEVRADAWVSWNGRPPARLIDPTVNLAAVEDGLAPADWISPPPTTDPVQLRRGPVTRRKGPKK